MLAGAIRPWYGRTVRVVGGCRLLKKMVWSKIDKNNEWSTQFLGGPRQYLTDMASFWRAALCQKPGQTPDIAR